MFNRISVFHLYERNKECVLCHFKESSCRLYTKSQQHSITAQQQSGKTTSKTKHFLLLLFFLPFVRTFHVIQAAAFPASCIFYPLDVWREQCKAKTITTFTLWPTKWSDLSTFYRYTHTFRCMHFLMQIIAGKCVNLRIFMQLLV